MQCNIIGAKQNFFKLCSNYTRRSYGATSLFFCFGLYAYLIDKQKASPQMNVAYFVMTECNVRMRCMCDSRMKHLSCSATPPARG
jgi:hypothetical protein